MPVAPADDYSIAMDHGKIVLELRHGEQLANRVASVPPLTMHLRDSGGDAEFLLAIPGRIQRHFRGSLELRVQKGELVAIVTEDIEELAAEIAAAEMSWPILPAALEAQVILSRSFLASQRGRHSADNYDFCDTTHCQFTQGCRIPESHRRAAANTRNLVLAFSGRLMPAYYAAVCGGHTRPFPEEIQEERDYPAVLVECPSCSQFGKSKGTSGVPASPFSGAANGHSLGLCQAGALEMAGRGRSRDEIIQHFFPYCHTILLSSAE